MDASGANLLMTFLEAQMSAFVGRELTANNVSYKVSGSDNCVPGIVGNRPCRVRCRILL